MLRLKDRINLNEDIAMPQDIKEIDINDLVLWADNPRDPFNKNASNQEIADRAISTDGRSRWNLKNLFKSMHLKSKPGSYDRSQIPTVVYVGKKPMVYDGNRRVLIGKIIHGCVEVETDIDFSSFDFPKKIPCNVCDKETALDNIELKHAKGGSWKPLERDVFMYNRGGEDPSFFMVLNEATGIISNYPFMNQGFVKEEVFSNEALKALNLSGENNRLESPYSNDELKIILDRIVELVRNKIITTRENRGELISLIKKDSKVSNIISKNKGNKVQPYKGKKFPVNKKHMPPSKKEKVPSLFGEDSIIIKNEIVNDLFLDLKKMHSESHKNKYTPHFPMIVRMGLRLLCHVDIAELVPKLKKKRLLTRKGITLEDYINDYFDNAKQKLNDKERNCLHEHSVAKNLITDVLNAGAHGNSYIVDKNKTVALSLIIGKILEETDGK